MSRKRRQIDAVLQYIADNGPCTKHEIEVPACPKQIERHVHTLHRTGAIRIRRWECNSLDGRRYPRAVYAVGYRPDAPKPAPKSPLERMREYRKKKRT